SLPDWGQDLVCHCARGFPSVQAVWERASQLLIRADHFPAADGYQSPQHPQIRGGLQEMHGAVREYRVRSARVKTVNLPGIRTVDGARRVRFLGRPALGVAG